MKYIKPFNNSVGSSDIIQNIEDILIDLYDDGFEIKIINGRKNIEIRIDIFVKETEHYFIKHYKPVMQWFKNEKDDIERLINYMKSESYNYSIHTGTGFNLNNINEYEENIKLNKLDFFLISFFKN